MGASLKQFQKMYFIFYFTIATFWAFAVPYLNSLEISNTKIGVIISLMIFAGVIGQFITGYLCDIKNTIKKIFIVYMILLCCSVALFFQSQNITYIIILISIIGFFQSSVMALGDSWVLESSSEIKENFGSIRALGSAGWGIAAVFVGKVIDKTGWHSLYIIYIICTVVLFFTLLNMQDAKGKSNGVNPLEPITSREIKELFFNKQYIQLLVIFFLLFSALQAVGMFSQIIINNYGGTKFQVGLYLFVAAFSEIPILFLAKLLRVRYKLSQLLIFSSFALTFRMILVAFSSNISLIIALGSFQIVTFSIIVFISKYLIDEISPAKLKTMSQMIAMAVYMGLSGIFSTTLSGWLADVIGIKNMLIFQGVLCFFAFLLSLRYHMYYYPKAKITHLQS
ncbi:Sugar phosphate permease [Alkaliphilus peptidifermentans DSM 18978]|uniref:Sugar phosphate permease n=2 Tax=Alkaliphilus TaxID=114627 RepID=A0A1G5FXR3_9FIRM|nr:Sugar phosphate permease [Alkaliphilus peptidifermentans DSM 18978]